MTGGQLKPTTPNLSTWSRGQRAGHTAHTAWKCNGMKAVAAAAAAAAAAQTSLFFLLAPVTKILKWCRQQKMGSSPLSEPKWIIPPGCAGDLSPWQSFHCHRKS